MKQAVENADLASKLTSFEEWAHMAVMHTCWTSAMFQAGVSVPRRRAGMSSSPFRLRLRWRSPLHIVLPRHGLDLFALFFVFNAGRDYFLTVKGIAESIMYIADMIRWQFHVFLDTIRSSRALERHVSWFD